MKNKLAKKLICLLSVCILSGSICACGNDTNNVSENSASVNTVDYSQVLVDHEESVNTVLMTIDDITVTREDLYLFILQYLYNNSTDADSITDAAYANIVNTCIDEIKMETVEYKLALVTDGIEVTDDALSNAKNVAVSFCNYFGEDFLNKYGISKDAVEHLFVQQAYIEALKNKTMQDLTNDYIESYNEQYGEMTFFTIYYALFPNLKYEDGNPVLDDNGNYISLNNDEMEEQYVKATEFHDKAIDNIKAGEADGNMEELVEEYGITYASGIEHNFHGAFNDDLNNLIDSLEDGDISEVTLTDAGYMIVRMDKTNDEDFKTYSIEYMASQSAQNMYPTMQDTWAQSSGVAGLSVDSTLLQGLKIVDMCRDMNAAGKSINGGN